MGLATALRNWFDPPALRYQPSPPRSSWDALELNGRTINVRLVSTKAAPPGYEPASLIDLGRSGSIAWSSDELSRTIREAFVVSGLVYRLMAIIADAFAEGVLRVVTDVDGKPEPIPDHPLRLLVSEPNPEQSEAEFWTLLLLTMQANGYGLVEKVRALSGEIVQLYPRNPQTHKRKKNDQGEIVWEQRSGGKFVRTIPDADMLVVPYQLDAGYGRLGVSWVTAVSREIGIDISLTQMLKLFLDEGGVPAFILVSQDPIGDDAEVEAIQEKWKQKYGGGRSWGTIPVLHGGFTIERVASNLDEMAWPELRGITELRIAQAPGVPPHLIAAYAAITNGGLSTTEVQQAMRLLQLYTIAPLRARVDGAFTRGIMREIEPDRNVYLQFDTSDILALQEDEDARAARLRADMQAGGVTREEFRRERGYEEQPQKGETYLMPFSIVEVIAGQVAEPTANPPAQTAPPAKALPRYRNVKALSPLELEVRSSLVDRNRRAQKKLSEIGERALRKFWRDQGERIAALAQKSVKAVDDLALVDWAEEERALSEILMRFYGTAGDLAAADATAFTGVEVAWDVANPNISRTMQSLGNRIKGISETTRLDVAKIVSDSLQEGVTIDELAGRLKTQFTETYRGRATTVARTESQVSYNTASVLSYQESGVVDECELSDNPEHVDDYSASDGLTCATRHGLVVKLSAVASHIEAEHPNGSLAVIPLLAGPALGEEN